MLRSRLVRTGRHPGCVAVPARCRRGRTDPPGRGRHGGAETASTALATVELDAAADRLDPAAGAHGAGRLVRRPRDGDRATARGGAPPRGRRCVLAHPRRRTSRRPGPDSQADRSTGTARRSAPRCGGGRTAWPTRRVRPGRRTGLVARSPATAGPADRFAAARSRGRRRRRPSARSRSSVPPTVTDALLTTLPAAFHGGVDDGLLAAARAGTDRAGGRGRRRRRVGRSDHPRGTRPRGAGRRRARTCPAPSAGSPRVYPGAARPRRDRCRRRAARAVPRQGERSRPSRSSCWRSRITGIGYGLLRYLATRRRRPLPPIAALRRSSFNYLGRIATRATDGAEDWLPVGRARSAARATPTCRSRPRSTSTPSSPTAPSGPRLTASFAFPTGVLDEAEVAAFADLWRRALDGACRAHVTPGRGRADPVRPSAGLG